MASTSAIIGINGLYMEIRALVISNPGSFLVRNERPRVERINCKIIIINLKLTRRNGEQNSNNTSS